MQSSEQLSVDAENQAWLCRITSGWKKSALPLEDVFCYWRDVHSPAIARRPGIWEYRHFQFDTVRPDLFEPREATVFHCPVGEQLMWTSDVRYFDEVALAAFSASPDPETRGHLLGDIELIVDQSTTYRAVNEMAHTFIDRSAQVPPQGPPKYPTYSLFFRARTDESDFRTFLKTVATKWSVVSTVQRLRLSMFEIPDMAAERASGYPIKTHPPDRQYQAWIDISIEAESDLASLVNSTDFTQYVSELHAYPVRAIYTSNQGGKPTFVGLRGYPAYKALTAIGGYNQAHNSILRWMYGDVAEGVELVKAAV